MARVIVMGVGAGSLPAAYDVKKTPGKQYDEALSGTFGHFPLTISNLRVAAGWRKPDRVPVPIGPNVERVGVSAAPSGSPTP